MTREVRSLTGLRGIAACYVVLYHMLQDVEGSGVAATVLRHGYVAVDVFFVLSGFVMAMVHGEDRLDRAGIGTFLRKRAARVYPLYAAVTLATLALCLADGIAISPGRIAVNALLLQGWGLGTAIVAPSWSLSAEFGAYLLFPLLVRAVLRGTAAKALACAALAFAMLIALSLVDAHPRSGPLDLYQSGTPAPLLRGVSGFVLGLAAFRLSRSPLFRRSSAPAFGNLLGLGIAALLAWPDADVAIVALTALLIAGLGIGHGGLVGRFLAGTVPHRLGVLSYSVYLVHFPIREWLRPALGNALHSLGAPHADGLATLAACAVTLAVASLTYRLIEKPARSMVRTPLRLVSTMP